MVLWREFLFYFCFKTRRQRKTGRKIYIERDNAAENLKINIICIILHHYQFIYEYFFIMGKSVYFILFVIYNKYSKRTNKNL